MRLLTALTSLFFLAACAAAETPDMTGIIGVSHRFGMAHACPVSESIALTNAHVADPFPLEKNAPVLTLRWSGGYLNPLSASWTEDVSLMFRPDSAAKFPRFYPQAQVAPNVGEQVWWVGYDWSKQTKAGKTRVFSANITSLSSGVIGLDKPTPPGSSGSCLLNAKGEVVGLIAWGISLENDQDAAFAVALYGKWFDLEKAQAALKERLEEASK